MSENQDEEMNQQEAEEMEQFQENQGQGQEVDEQGEQYDEEQLQAMEQYYQQHEQQANFERSDYEEGEELTHSQMEQLQRQMQAEGLMEDSQDQHYEEGEEGEQYQNQDDSGQQPQMNGDSDEADFDEEEQLRKVRRDLLEKFKIEKERERNQDPMYLELLSNIIANQYAEYLIDNEHNEQFFHDTLIKQNNFKGEYHLCNISSYYEVDVEQNEQQNYEYFMEIGYLFLESTEEKKHILNPEINHVGVGVALDKDKVVIVLMLSTKALAVQRICRADNGGIEVRGKILKTTQKDKDQKEIGLFAIKVVSSEDTSKEIGRGSGPDKIQYNRQTKEFIATLDNHELDQGTTRYSKYLEFYTRINPDSIPYGKKSRDSEKPINYKYIDFQLSAPCLEYPDPRYAEEDEAERLKRDQELRIRQEQERQQMEQYEKEMMEAAMVDNKDDDENEEMEGSDEEGDSKQGEEEVMKKPENKEPVISNKEIREDLERAINEAIQQHKEFMDLNIIHQQRIRQLRSRNEIYVERQTENAMNDHKYLNTLAHVHQIRLDLQQTQKNYNAMAQELQSKLQTKQKKCNEIKLAFMELKREIARKAAHSRNDKPIPERQIEEWEEKEIEKDKQLQELRLDNLRLRNTLIKNQKILKKKEELAEGLHLIDFEQLKIENQTLNEKIEERNEDLHKLKKKNTTTVQILTHRREKLKFVQKKNETLKKENEYYEHLQNEKRNELSKAKEMKDKNQQVVQQYQQITGISRSNALKEDFKRLQEKVYQQREERESLKNQLKHMKDTITDYESLKIKLSSMQMQQ